MRRHLKLLMLISLLNLSSTAQAVIITYEFAGTLTSGLGSLSSGDAFSGAYTVDTDVVATGTSNSQFAVFNNLTGVSLTIGGFTAQVGPGTGLPEIQQDDVAGADRYALLGRNAVGSSQIGGFDLSVIGFRLDDTSGTAITNALDLLTDPVLSNFTSNTFLLFFVDSQGQLQEVVTGALTQLSQVPEPAALVLFGVGLAGLGALRAKRRPA